MRSFALIIGLLIATSAGAQRVIKLIDVPENTPPESTIYLATSSNGWNPGDDDWAFEDMTLNVPAQAPNAFEGKFTRGSWDTVEGNAEGGFLPNRSFDFTASDTLEVSILSWEGEVVIDDLPENLFVFDEAFYMPTLDRTRRIRVLLPLDYDGTVLHYPVLYMHDGQNLFSDQESFAGEWQVDEAMEGFEAQGYPGAIIVAIDNGGSYRIDEYTPYANPSHGGGEGQAYVDFIADYLKPAIDDSLRTLTDRENTGIMGSSLGGLISFYAGLYRPDVFAKVGAFSPSFWFSDSIYDFAAQAGYPAPGLFYFLAGGQEGQNVIGDVNAMIDTMTGSGYPAESLRVEFDPNGQHSEWFWAERFPEAFQWLFIDGTLGIKTGRKESVNLQLYPNPAHDTVFIALSNGEPIRGIEIFDVSGRLVFSRSGEEQEVDVSGLPSGTYQMTVRTRSSSAAKTFIKQ